MPRPRNPKPQAKRLVYMDQELFDWIDIMHLDPVTQQPTRGAFSKYIKTLVLQDKERRRRAAQQRRNNHDQ